MLDSVTRGGGGVHPDAPPLHQGFSGNPTCSTLRPPETRIPELNPAKSVV